MTDDELEALLERLEAALADEVGVQLSQVATDFARSVEGATELVAAVFRVSSIREMWRRRVPRIMTALRRITGRAATAVADDLDAPAPDVAEALRPYEDATEALLDAVGDTLAAEAVRVLSEGLNAGDDVDALKDRLTAAFADDGTKLGPGRAQRIAMTEATRAWNAATLATAEAVEGPERPLVKQWVTRNDNRVRIQHREANGQLRLLSEPFDVAGVPMQYPGDPAAPADLTVSCRCVMRVAAATREGTASMTPDNLTAGADGSHRSGAMIALVPSAADADRLALPGGEETGQLHLTLFFLGDDGNEWDESARAELVDRVTAASRKLSPVLARAFGAAQWNPAGESPCWVYNVGDHTDAATMLHDVYWAAQQALEGRMGGPELPGQYTPWAPHVCAAYTSENVSEALAARCGEVTFDRIRLAFAGEEHDIPLGGGRYEVGDHVHVAGEPHEDGQVNGTVEEIAEGPVYGILFDGSDEVHRWYTGDELSPGDRNGPGEDPRIMSWSTPGDTALAFEDEQTGDGRVFAPGALYWTGGPWPLQYADEMNGGHEGARLAGVISGMARQGGRITGAGNLYLNQDAGLEAAMLLSQGAPLGVSVDLDDVDIQMVDATGEGPQAPAEGFDDDGVYRAHLITASMLPLPGGGWILTGETSPEWTASGESLAGESVKVMFHVGADGRVPADAFDLEEPTGAVCIRAAAGDSGSGGVVVDVQRSGQFLMRITRARVRGATLVSIPAYDRARIVLDDPSRFAAAASLTAGAAANDYDRVVRHVRKSLVPVTAADVAVFLKMRITAVRRHLARAAQKGQIMRITRGTYVKPNEEQMAASSDTAGTEDELTAAATGGVDLPVAGRDREWDGDAAEARVFAWADGDCSKLDRAFAYRADDADCAEHQSRKLGYADIIDGTLTIVPRGVFAAQAAVEGARGGVDIPADQLDAVRDRLAAVRRHVDEVTGGDNMAEMEASAWTAMRELDPMPAAWFAEPTAEELPPGGPGVNYSGGRIFGWVAQAGEPHAGFAKKVTIDGLGRIDTTHFLRQRFTLDDGSSVKAGAFTMNAGHHRDGAECETAACQFDDTRFVAGIVTVGMNERGMWFSGAAAPWLSEWDRRVFMATQPSYHMRKSATGQWQLRAVLSVPVPGHSSPLLASAVAERAQVALTAAVTMAAVEEGVEALQDAQADVESPVDIDYDALADALVAAFQRAEQKDRDDTAELQALMAEARELTASWDVTVDGDITGTEGD